MTDGFENLPAIVRAGHPLVNRQFAESEHPAWTEFARSMAPLAYVVAQQTARLLEAESEMKVLDVAAGHGMFGIAVAHRNPKASVVAMDWPSVLAIAQENAERAGIADRYQLLPGDAREIDFGASFDAILIPNLLHMWDRSSNECFLKKVYSALAPGGRAIVVELAPNDDRTSPAIPALFALNTLANTSAGDAYTVSEYRTMLNQAGFPNLEVRPLLPNVSYCLYCNQVVGMQIRAQHRHVVGIDSGPEERKRRHGKLRRISDTRSASMDRPPAKNVRRSDGRMAHFLSKTPCLGGSQ